ncbi:hypothetical protein D3C84_1100130 [compost metagenome]
MKVTLVTVEVPQFIDKIGVAFIFTVAILESFTQGAVPNKVYVKLLVVAPTAGVNVPAAALNIPPDPVALDQVPPVCSPVIKL